MGKTINARSLARWRRSPAKFIEEVLRDPETGKPFRLLPAEREFLRHAFRTDGKGRLLYPEQVYSCPKKSGKTGFNGMHVLITTLLFGGRFAEAYCVANDFEQAQARVFTAIRRIVEASPLLRCEARITGNKVTFPSTGAVITAIASDYAGAAGSNPVISSFDELWGYTLERSHRLWDEMIPPPTRKIACRLTTTYAGFEGESKLLEELYKRGLKQPQIGPDLYAGDGLLMFWSHTPIAPWQTPEWIAQMRSQLRPHAFTRMIENHFAHSEESFVDLKWWDDCAIARPILVDPNMPVWVAVDASTKRDSTGITVVTWDREVKKPRLVWHRIITPTPKQPIDFEEHIEETLLSLKARFQVRQVFYDPYQMAATAQRMQRAGLPMVEFPQSPGNLTAASQNLYELIKARGIVSYPDADIRLALQRSIAVETTRGWRIAKEKVSHRIDIVVALAMAALGAVQKGDGGHVVIGCQDGSSLHPDGAGGWTRRWSGQDSRLRFVHADELGNELTPEQARARQNQLPGRKKAS